MPDGASHHFDRLIDPTGNLNDDNLNSLDAGGNVWPVAGELKVNVEPAIFNSSSSVMESYAGAVDQVVAPSTTNYVYLVPGPTLVINATGFPVAEHCPLAEVDTGSAQVTTVRDRRPKLSSLVGSGPPSGPAGPTKLSGTYPDPGFTPGAIVNADVNAAAAIAEAKLALNFATHSNANDPTTNEKAALVGTGTPGAGDPYVNNSDARMTDARTPTAHASSHQHGGSDEIGTATPGANAVPKADGSGKLDSWITQPAFGQNQQLQSGASRTTTVSATPVMKVQLVTGAVPAGTYRLRWGCDVDNNNAANPGTVRLQDVTGAATLDSHVYGQAAIPLTDAKHVGGTVDIALSATNTFEIQFYDNAGGNTQGIARAWIEFQRVA